MKDSTKPAGSGSVFYNKARDLWVAQVYVRDSGQRSRRTASFKTREEAEAALADLRRTHGVRPGAEPAPVETPHSVTVFFDRSRGKWVGQHRVMVNGKRKARTVVRATEREALQAIEDLLAADLADAPPPPPASSETVGSWISYYVEHVLPEEGLAPESVSGAQAYARRELIPAPFARKRLADLAALDVMKFLNGLVDDDRGASTRKNIRVVLNKSLRSAVLHGRLDPGIVLALQGQTSKRAARAAPKPRRVKTVTRSAIRRLVAQAEADGWEPIVTTLLGTGLRRGEVVALRWRDLDLKAGTMDYVGAIAGDGKGGEVYGPTKTGETFEAEPLAPQVVASLERWKRRQAEIRLAYTGTWAAGDEFEDYVFTTPHGTRYTADWVTKRIERLARDAGVGHITPHMLRHTAASYLAEQGVDTMVIARVLHHASDRVTREVYIHELDEARARGTAALTAYLGRIAAE